MTWRTFSEALWRPTNPENPPTTYDGIGFVFCSADPYVGVDLDNCRDPEVGTVAEWAQKIIDSFADSYVEASPSGTGVHIIFEGTLKDGAKKKKQSTGIEAYGQDRYRETGDDDNKNEARAEDRENKRAQSTEPALQGGLSQKKVREVLGEPAYYQGPARALAEYREDPSAENLARLTRSIRFSPGICPRRGGSARSGWSGPPSSSRVLTAGSRGPCRSSGRVCRRSPCVEGSLRNAGLRG
jgi:hypothetical protein